MEALAVRMIKTPVVYAKFDLAVAVRTTANGIEGSAEYRTALFDASTIDRFFDDLLGVLDVVIADPETKLSNVILRSQLLDSPLAI
jgi:non-ribosomal peptide synthetase component F